MEYKNWEDYIDACEILLGKEKVDEIIDRVMKRPWPTEEQLEKEKTQGD